MAVSSATTETKSKFGVPLSAAGGAGMLQPRLKWKFNVSFLNNFGGQAETRVLSQNVQSVTKPKITHESLPVDSYNSRMYYQGKHTWEPIQVTFKDDITNQVARLIGAQEQRQMNHYQQTTPVAASDFKFDMQIETLDGTNAGATDVWFLEGCFLTNVDYGDLDFSSSDMVMINMTVQYDNAIHFEGDNDSNGRVVGGNPFPETVATNTNVST